MPGDLSLVASTAVLQVSLPETPFESPELVFALAMVVFLIAPLLLERFRLPGIIGIILVGAAVGPDGLGLLGGDAIEGIELLGEVGLIFLMFVAGVEIHFNQFLEYRDRSLVFGALSFLIPQAAGFAVGLVVLDLSVAAALLFGAIFSSHTLLAYPVVNKFDIADRESITATIGGTILTDTLALLVLAVVVATAADGGTGTLFWLQFAGGLVAFFAGVWVVVPRLGKWFFRNNDEESYFEFLFVMAVLFVCAVLAEVVGVKHIIGAFLAGLALNRLIPKTGPLMNRIEFVGNALLIPFFLLWVGTLIDVSVLFDGPDTLVIAGTLTALLLTTKLLASWLAGQVYSYDSTEVLGMFGLSVGQAAAALAIVIIGFEEGIPGFDQAMVNGAVVMILVASIVSPLVVTRVGKRLVEQAEREGYDPRDSPERILVPLSRESQYWDQLLDLAIAIRSEHSAEPVHTVTVVPPGEEIETEANVADLEEVMDDIESYGASAEVAVETHTTVEHNVAAGIAREALENRATTIVIGWDGARSRRQRTFGRVIDQVLSRTTQLTLVGRVREPLNTTSRIVLVLPPGATSNTGFFQALHAIKEIAQRTGSVVQCYTFENVEGISEVFELVDPEVTAEFEQVDDWAQITTMLREDTDLEDLVVLMSARRGDVNWERPLQRLPSRVSTLTEGNFVIVYPAGNERARDNRFLQFR